METYDEVMESYDDVKVMESYDDLEVMESYDDVKVMDVHPAAVSHTTLTYIKRLIFEKLCFSALGLAEQEELFMMYHEVDKCAFLLGHRYNQIFRYVMSLNIN
jgi:hypothetical protein